MKQLQQLVTARKEGDPARDRGPAVAAIINSCIATMVKKDKKEL